MGSCLEGWPGVYQEVRSLEMAAELQGVWGKQPGTDRSSVSEGRRAVPGPGVCLEPVRHDGGNACV